jgi:hypothetical protein
MDRKTFIRDMARLGLLGVLAATAGILLSRKQVRLEKQCGIGIQCSACRRLSSCAYPEALEEKGGGNGKG